MHPPISLDIGGAQDAIHGIRPGYFVTVGRGRGYKNLEHLLSAFAALREERLVVVGTAPKGASHPPNVQFVARPRDAELRWLYSNATALVSVSHEDFGLTPLEANALGTPALVLKAGGFLDSTHEGTSGLFIANERQETIIRAIRDFPREWDKEAIRRHAEQFSLRAFVQRLHALILERTESYTPDPTVQQGDAESIQHLSPPAAATATSDASATC